jgi:UDP-N-acetylglucosamine diphosphorylase/glucosamine-1-phosphate N-acetyltransferase
MRVCLFEDRFVADLEPLTLTRPAFDLLCGLSSLADRQCRCLSPSSLSVLVRPHLAKWWHTQSPEVPANDAGWLRAGPAVLVNARWLPPAGRFRAGTSPCVGVVGDEVAYAVLTPEHLSCCTPDTIDECLDGWKAVLPHREAGGRLFRHLWEVVDQNGEQLVADFADCGLPGEESAIRNPQSAMSMAVVGPRDRVRVHPTARLDPMVVLDTTQGPVVIAEGAVVHAFTRLEGPCFVGPRTQLLGAKVRAGTTLGPDCRIGGEVEASIVQGFSNKYHDGFLGHAYVGSWVNLGAGTQNSDLRNDYGPVSVTVNGRVVHTGRTKVGCYLGDHTKSGLGALLNTGTNAGAFCNLLPGSLLPRYVPSFASWWNGAISDRADLWNLLQTAAKVMRRRGCAFTEAHADMYRAVFEQTGAERARAVREAEMRRLRRSA